MVDYDIIIIGTGAAGFTGATYATRRNLKTLVLGDLIGGQMILAHMIENYPGIDEISGMELTERMRRQAEKFGAIIKTERVVDMDLKGNIKKIKTDEGEYRALTVMLAMGGHHRMLNVAGEDKFLGKGVSYCATCDAPLFRGKKVAIVGGGDSAVWAGIYLADLCTEVYMIHRRNELKAEEANKKKLLAKKNVKFVWNTEIQRIDGTRFVEKLILKNVETNQVSELKVDGLFIEIGQIPTTELAKKAGVEVDDKDFIKTNINRETNVKGVFAAGDCCGGVQQIVSSAGEAATAAIHAYFYIQELKHQKEVLVDWGEKK